MGPKLNEFEHTRIPSTYPTILTLQLTQLSTTPHLTNISSHTARRRFAVSFLPNFTTSPPLSEFHKEIWGQFLIFRRPKPKWTVV